MARTKTTPRRGLRQPRAAAQASRAINSTLLGTKRNIVPALAANVDFNVASSSVPTAPVKLGRPKPSGGVGVKKIEGQKKQKNLKIKRLLPQSRVVTVKKNGVAVRKMTVRRRSYFPGRRRKVYK